ncbi:hypothetical protein BAE44_0002559 [Dichanthelium oligosanthes]|uniref:Uncharacterized protein n=1 Tax=Dichanthelium oligosanthes TaxID=888268 RepID=A0A1E5WGF1_9POAL|nr:hypothetical protein BAE44_0002559 [Dichanthelium oligosanthes]
MSRCFPYPPPGYVRNPVAVAVAEAETTAKLQKEREKAEKKKEKRKDKKAHQQGEASKHSKHSHKKRKHEEVSTAGQEPKMVSTESVEQLEKSGLSEEHGAPCFTQTVRDSPESSQDSSKRRKVLLPSPSQVKNGNVLRIKIKSNQDPQAAVLEKPNVIEQPLVQQMGSGSLLSKQNSIQHDNKVNVRSAAAKQRINGNTQAVQKRVITEPPARIMQRVAPQPAVKVTTQLVDRQLSVKSPVGTSDLLPPRFLGSVDPSPARATGRSDPQPAKMVQRVQHPPAKILQKDPQLPSGEIQRKSPAGSMKVAQKEFRSPAIRLPEAPQLPLLQKPKDLPVLKQQQEPATSLPKEEPCFSGRNAEAAPVQESKLSRSDRKKLRKSEKKEKKSEKKEKKFSDLFITWNPVSLEVEGPDLGEQDWLLGSVRNSDASINCRASDSSVPFQSMEQQHSLQPRATLLPDLHMYSLPYVIPF